ncbi:MAG: OsmC family protein [Deltaproteobacteria bacterium]|nr:OsmC family protein [Deltaproteobacteria bacterium]
MAGQKRINGLNVSELFKTIDLIKENPEIGKFKFRATNKWINGTHNRAKIKDFYGALEEDHSRKAMIYELDEPPILLGKNKGSNPVEYLLVALSGCVTTSLIAYASVKGIEINKVESRYEGDIDLRGFLGISEDVPVGYQNIRVYFKIEANVSMEQKEELIQIAQKYSPVFNTLTKSVPVSVQLDKEG